MCGGGGGGFISSSSSKAATLEFPLMNCWAHVSQKGRNLSCSQESARINARLRPESVSGPRANVRLWWRDHKWCIFLHELKTAELSMQLATFLYRLEMNCCFSLTNPQLRCEKGKFVALLTLTFIWHEVCFISDSHTQRGQFTHGTAKSHNHMKTHRCQQKTNMSQNPEVSFDTRVVTLNSVSSCPEGMEGRTSNNVLNRNDVK